MNTKLVDRLKGGAWGIVIGAAVLGIVGFTWGGWTTHDQAVKDAQQAVNQALVPFCAQAFVAQATPEQKVTFEKTSSYSQDELIAEIVKLPGQTSFKGDLSKDCAAAAAELMKKTAAAAQG